ncbi:hypothetical protein AAG570_006006 [Ranatra chinensis]|uniref:Reverse transcriptase RNase H-like domain-containing protein n=1 Tax=Ranatra chinensis TaxID=642074 RepID=A0ABD0XWS4_9HEMI
MVGYYRKFTPNLADSLAPWTRFLRKGLKFVVTADMIEEFNRIKKALTNAPVLRYPDFTRPFVLTTDASGVAVGAVLSQVEDGKDRPIAYASKKLADAETRYPSSERELLGVVWGVQQFRPYLWGRHFTVRTDRKPLVWVDKLKENSARVTRWMVTLAAYDFSIGHTRDSENVVADCLSRLVNATSVADPQDAPVDPEPFGLRHLREWAESGPDLEVREPEGLRYLLEWAESGPDLPPAEPGPSAGTELMSPGEEVGQLSWSHTIVNNMPRQVILEAGTEQGVTVTHTSDPQPLEASNHELFTVGWGAGETVRGFGEEVQDVVRRLRAHTLIQYSGEKGQTRAEMYEELALPLFVREDPKRGESKWDRGRHGAKPSIPERDAKCDRSKINSNRSGQTTGGDKPVARTRTSGVRTTTYRPEPMDINTAEVEVVIKPQVERSLELREPARRND